MQSSSESRHAQSSSADHRVRIGWRRLLLAVIGLAAAPGIGLGGHLFAQACIPTPLDPCPPNHAPSVRIAPAGGPVTTTTVAITVYLDDDISLNPGSLTASPAISLSGNWGPNNASATLTGSLTLSAGPNIVIVDIADGEGLHGADTVTFTYTPPPPPPSQAPAVLSLAAHRNAMRTVAGCSGCLYGVATYATPAYVSRDVPQSIQLLYASSQAVPMALVQVDATVNTTTTPDLLSIRLLQNGSPVPLTNEGTEAFYTGATGALRLAAQIDATSWTTPGASDYVAVVRTWWGGTGGTFYESQVPVGVLVPNAKTSVIGAGWTIAGLQRLWFRIGSAGTEVWLTDGSGTITYFGYQGSPTFGHAAGDFTTLTRNSVTGVYTRTSPDGSFARFNTSGLMTATGNRFGDSTVYTYDGSSRLTTITDEAGQTTTLTYAPDALCATGATNGTLCAITTPGGRVSKFVVNGSNDLVQIIDPDGVTAFTGTYVGHRLMSATDRLAAATQFTYDAFGGLASRTTPAVTTTTTGGSTSSEAATTAYRSIEATLLSTTNASAGGARAVVRADTAFATTTAPNGTVTKMVLQGAGEPTRVEVHPVTGTVQTSTVTYNDDDLPTSIAVSPVGGITSYFWNGDLLTNTTDPNGVHTEFGHETTFHQPTVTWVNGAVQSINYYSGPLAKLDSTVAGQAKTTYAWDAHGRLTGTNDRQGHTTTRVYETGGFQNTQQQWVGGFPTQMVHDAFGRDSVVIDPASQVTVIGYDLLNRPTVVAQPGNAVTSTSYSENTSLQTMTTTVTDPRGLAFTTVQNALGWVTATTDPQAIIATAGYDRNGFLRRAVDRAGGVITFDYDSLGRVLSRAASTPTSYTYDPSTSPADPHWTVAANAESRDSVATDAKGRVMSVVSTRGMGAFRSTMTYDNADTRRTLTISNGTWTQALEFANDSIRFPFLLPDFGGQWTAVRYNSEQLLDTLRYPTGGASTRLTVHPWGYSAYHRPTVVDVAVGSALREQSRYVYDGHGRISVAATGSDRDWVERQYGYDARGRLANYADHHIYADSVQESCPDFQITCDPPPPWDLTWYDQPLRGAAYNPDHSGNRTDGSASVIHDRLSTMTGADGRAYTFSYDDEGRVRSKTASGYSQTYGWDALGQLLWVVTNGDSVAFGYDAAGHRIRKDHAGATTGYLWDGDQLVMELDGSGNPRFEYSYQGLDQPVAVKASGGMFYYQLDEVGNVVGLWNTSNVKVRSYTYDPFGYLLASSGTVTQPLGWKGREYDAETGLYYVRARYYDPTVGRFLSEDPLGVSAGINPYTFADGDPVNFSDPSGMCDEYIAIPYIDDDGVEHINLQKVVCSEAKESDFWAAWWFVWTHYHAVMDGVRYQDQRPVEVGMPWYIAGGGPASAAEGATSVIGRTKDLGNLAKGERSLLDRLTPDLGSAKANWARNSSVLRQEMRRGLPIRDASPGDMGGTFLNAERALLRERGWTFNSATGYWMPPVR